MLSIAILSLVVVTNLLLGIFVIANNPQGKVNQALGGFAIALAAWSVVTFLEDAGLSHSLVRGLVVLDFTLATLMAVLFYLFCVKQVDNRSKLVGRVVLALAALSLVLAWTGKVVSVQFDTAHTRFVPELGYWVFSALAALAIVGGLTLLIRHYRRNVGRVRAQVGFVLMGVILSAIVLVVTNMILPNLITVPSDITRLGIYGILFFTTASVYSIVKHRFMDLRLIVARSVAYILLLTVLATAYGLMIFGTTTYLFPQSSTSTGQNIVYIILALIMALTFQPLRRVFERVTDSFFFRNRYESQQVLAEFSNVLVRDIELNDLMKHSLVEISKSLSIGYSQLIIFNEGKVYRVAQHGLIPKRMIVAPQLKGLSKPLIIADELNDGETKEIMDDHGIRVSAVLKTHNEVIGHLLLGDKLSGDIYSKQDIEVIGIMAKELAVAISNAKAYAEIQAFAETLQERVTHATSRLRVANRHLKELDQAKDEFLSLASHQLRTPLTTIKGYLSMVLEGDAGKITKTQREFTQNAFDGSERMVRLITDLLDVSRMSAGRFVIQPKETDMNEVVRSEVEQLQSHAATKGLKLSLQAPSTDIPMIMLDENKTRQVIMNFVDNAIYYTDKGSVTVVLTSQADRLRLEVRDTGMGVPPAEQKHLFSKFFRAANAQQSRPDGTGLGLFLAKRVIEDQGGMIIFRSEVGKGSVFGFELPMVLAKSSSGGVAKPIIASEVKVSEKA